MLFYHIKEYFSSISLFTFQSAHNFFSGNRPPDLTTALEMCYTQNGVFGMHIFLCVPYRARVGSLRPILV